jgi:CDP-diacylglycerol--glycerol-3-phosphate 3-phosphatidyltransferase
LLYKEDKHLGVALYLTLTRIVLSPIFLIVYLYHENFGISLVLLPYILILLLCISELSDIFDGIWARRKNQVTDLGKLLDPMADSIFRLSVFLTFTQGLVKLPLLLVLFFFYRDTIISTLRTVCALRGSALGARLSGKVKAVIQAIVAFFIIILMIPYSLGYISLAALQTISFYAVLAAVIYTIASGAEYLYAHRASLKKALNRL